MESTLKKDFSRFISIIPGSFLLLYFCLKNRKTHYVICSYGLGDAMLALAYLPAFKKTKHHQHITVIGKKRMVEVYKLYSETYDECILLSDKFLTYLTNAMHFDLPYYVFARWLKRITAVNMICFMRHYLLIRSPGLTMLDTIRSGGYGLFKDSAMCHPNFPKVYLLEHFKKYQLGKTVILSPYANSLGKIPMEIFEQITENLRNKGFDVVTNITGKNERPVKGTDAISLDLISMIEFTKHCGYVVAFRSGFCDFIQYSKCKMVIIYPSDHVALHFYSMKQWNVNSDIYEFRYKEDILAAVGEVCQQF